MDVNNTKEKKAQILADLKLFSSKTDEYSKLQVLKILGYKNFEDYSIVAKKTSELVNRINEKYPAFKELPKDSMQAIFIKATQLLQNDLPYKIYPNKNGIASIYYNDNLNLKLPTERIRDCCQDVWNKMQSCYLVYDYAYFFSITFACPAACAGFFEAPPLAYGCIIGCIGLSGFAYGAGLDYCTNTAYVDSSSCPDSCF